MTRSAAAMIIIVFSSAFAVSGVATAEAGLPSGSLTGLAGLSRSDIAGTAIFSVSRRARGTVEQIYLDNEDEIEALRISWSRGPLQSGFSLTQTIERFSYDPGQNAIFSDADADRLAVWAAADADDERVRGGIDINRISPHRLMGEQILVENSREYGRVAAVSYGANGEIVALTLTRRTGWFVGRTISEEIPAQRVRWSTREQAIRLIAEPSA